MTVDPLSEVLSLLRPRNYMSAGFEAGGDWAIQFPHQGEGIKTGAVVSGNCWLVIDGMGEPVRLEQGDCFVLPSGRAFRMGTDLSLSPTHASDHFSPARNGGIVRVGEGGDFFCVSSRFALDGAQATFLMKMLPPAVVIREEAGRESLRWSVERMMREMREPRPGSPLVIQHLAHMMLVEALRLYLAEGAAGGTGWLFALADRRIGAAIRAMHAEPARRWTLADLGHEAGMSRSTFAERFREMAGLAPMAYLTRWRMALACERLAHASDPVSAIALSLGYESESAFSTAFKREMGCSPRQWARAGTAASSVPERDAAE